MAVAGMSEVFQSLQQADFFTGLLPFVIVYSIFYIALINAPKFKESERITTLISASFAFLSSFFILQSPFYQSFIIDYFGFLAVGLLGVIGLIVALMLTGFKDWLGFGPEEGEGNLLGYGLGAVAIFAAISAFTSAGGLGVRAGSGTATGAVQGLFNLIAYTINTGLIWGVVILLLLAFGFSSGLSEDNGNGGVDETPK